MRNGLKGNVSDFYMTLEVLRARQVIATLEKAIP